MMNEQLEKQRFYNGLVFALAERGVETLELAGAAYSKGLQPVAECFQALQAGANKIAAFPTFMYSAQFSGSFPFFTDALHQLGQKEICEFIGRSMVQLPSRRFAASVLESNYTPFERTVLSELAGKYKAPTP